MKTIYKSFLSLILIAGLVIGCNSKNTEMPIENTEESSVLNATETLSDEFQIPPVESIVNPGTITEQDVKNIIYMYEEEKLANDVYVFFNNKFKKRVFENISKSETRHQKAIVFLVDLFDVQAPLETAVGVFNIEELQTLYTKLTTEAVTAVDAFKVGAYIEEHDIVDLKKAISETQNPYVKRVFSNLLRGSQFHLKAYVANLKFNNVIYAPQILTKQEFDAIMGS